MHQTELLTEVYPRVIHNQAFCSPSSYASAYLSIVPLFHF
jgi:hypothetical protein